MSDTPRTDTQISVHDEASVGGTAGYNDLVYFAREQERELTEVYARAERAEADREQLRAATIEECAKECDEQAERYERRADDLHAKGPLTFEAEIDRWRCRANQAKRDAHAIRALAKEEKPNDA